MSNIGNDRVTYWNDTPVRESSVQPHTQGYVLKVIRDMGLAVVYDLDAVGK